jgi:DNA polymerase-3 subunit alpha
LCRGQPSYSKEPDHPDSAKSVRAEYRHLILLAETTEGLKNLWAASTAANHPDAFYDRPRMDWGILERFNEGVLCSTACLRGPLAQDLLQGREDRARATLARLMSIYDGRLWLELQTNVNALPIRQRVIVENDSALVDCQSAVGVLGVATPA